MSVGSRTAIPRRASLAGSLAGVLALGAVVVADTTAAYATETLALKTVVSMPGGAKITSFDISFVDPVAGFYVLGDRTNKGIDVISTATNTLQFTAGAGLFKGVVLVGGVPNNDLSGPDGTMIVRSREIWAGDGDSTLKILSLSNGALLATISTGGLKRVDEMCFDPVHNIGFVANNADSPPFVTAVSARSHSIIGKIVFNGTNGTPNATDGIEQCQYNPRDGMIYLAVPEIGGPGDNSAPGGVARINPATLTVTATAVIPLAACTGPQGLAIGPVVGTFGQMLLGCNGATANAAALRPTALVDDGSRGGTFGAVVALPWQAGNDEVAFNGIVTASGTTQGDGHYYLARSGNNSPVNPNVMVDGFRPHCPSVPSSTLPGGNYGGDIYVSANTQGEAYAAAGSQTFAGPQVLGMINATTLENDPDTIIGQFSCTGTTFGAGGQANTHGTNHSVAADPVHNQIYVPIASTAFTAPATGPCSAGGGSDTNGCIAVYATQGSDP